MRLPIKSGWLLVLPFLLLVGGLFLGPILNVLWISVTDPAPGFGNYAQLGSSDTLRRILWTTLRVCVICTAFSVILGYSIAYAMVHATGPAQSRMVGLLLISFWISVLVRTFSWLMLLGRNGVVNSGLEALGIITAPIAFMRNELGVLIGMVHYMVPYAVLPMLAAMREIDPRLLAAARGLGASRFTVFSRIFLPLSAPGLIAAGVLVFIVTLGFYITPAILGGGKTLMAAEWIKIQILDLVRWGMGAMLATVLVVAILTTLAVFARVVDLRRVFGGGR